MDLHRVRALQPGQRQGDARRGQALLARRPLLDPLPEAVLRDEVGHTVLSGLVRPRKHQAPAPQGHPARARDLLQVAQVLSGQEAAPLPALLLPLEHGADHLAEPNRGRYRHGEALPELTVLCRG